MTRHRLPLSIALSDNPNTRPLIDGRVAPEGIRLTATVIHPSEMFWRQLRFAEFDVSEMSMSSLLIATARGPTPWVALPVFTTREFFHTRILVRADAGIASPADLKGKRVGVPEYQQTAAIWGRGVLESEFGVRPRDMEFFMERVADKSHGGATGFEPPAGVTVHQIPASTNIGEMLVRGELDATLLYLTDRNLVDRSRIDLSFDPRVRPLFADRAAEGRRYYAKTGIYPINHAVVVRRTLLEKHPWIALNLFPAFAAARAEVLRAGTTALASHFETGVIGEEVRRALATDPMAYGVKATRKVLETIADYVHAQGLTDRRVKIEELFALVTMDL
ncbi:MAG TPA: PhnD/SsuA/transferrin family substrate-binding protein [Xanthobacteraceae bacterium]|nr:PhnD/SsuA/transferrin family substrate-binding protein [Xanthobacteraceae bacterium]